jgi:hypothetical protein
MKKTAKNLEHALALEGGGQPSSFGGYGTIPDRTKFQDDWYGSEDTECSEIQYGNCQKDLEYFLWNQDY